MIQIPKVVVVPIVRLLRAVPVVRAVRAVPIVPEAITDINISK